MNKIEFLAMEVSNFGKLDYCYVPQCETAIKYVDIFKSAKGITKKTLNKTNIVELANMLAIEGIEVDFVIGEVKEMTRPNKVASVGDSILKTVKPKATGLFK